MKKRILIVDDEPGIVRLLTIRLKIKGYEVLEANDGVEGEKIAIKEVPDLILMDVKMPNGGGIAAFERLLQFNETKKIPVIFMTAYPKNEITNQVIKMGARGCISKPFISEDFEQSIETALQ